MIHPTLNHVRLLVARNILQTADLGEDLQGTADVQSNDRHARRLKPVGKRSPAAETHHGLVSPPSPQFRNQVQEKKLGATDVQSRDRMQNVH